MDQKIVKFIKEHHVITLATSKDNIPWSAHCFYAFLKEENALVFTTDDTTRHATEMLENQKVSGGIVLETKVVGKIRGVQLTGKVHKLNNDSKKKTSSRTERSEDPGPDSKLPEKHKGARKAYLRRFPYAVLMKTSLWIL